MRLKSTEEIFKMQNMPEGHDPYATVVGALKGRIGFLLSAFERQDSVDGLKNLIRNAFEDICED